FTQLPDAEKEKMREAWQKMSTQERNDLRQRMLKANGEERTAIREEYMNKYLEH
ncbi:MAG: restriction endonuclease, partial [Acinetobacter calcoaceticus]